MTFWHHLTTTIATDPAAPRVTFYERTPGPSEGERIELSGKVLLNWVSKAANLLSEEFDVEPGSVVALHLPSAHWRTVYWLLAAWSTGASVAFTDSDTDREAPKGDVRISAVPTDAEVDVYVTMAALARTADIEVPHGAMDEARELATFPDQFSPHSPAAGSDVALPGVNYEALCALAPAERAHLEEPTPELLLAGVLGGGVVLVRGPVDADALAPLLRQEGILPS